LFHLKNRLKTRVALIELLDLSGIAVGNVRVPTCYCKKKFFAILEKKYLCYKICYKSFNFFLIFNFLKPFFL
jgi:hypothetical protein